jgi:aldose 1-epimerase
MRLTLLVLLTPLLVAAGQRFTASRIQDHGMSVVRLADSLDQVEVLIAPSIGNRAYALKVHGQNLLFFPSNDIAKYKTEGAKGLNGIPFLAPWANRMADSGFWADGKRYTFEPQLGSVHIDANGIAIHGMLITSDLWEITEVSADKESATVKSKLQFWRHPELMANWPFAQEYEMVYVLRHRSLEVRTAVKNLSQESIPLAIGYHPYFNIPGVLRSETSVHIPASLHVETDSHLVATGEMKPANLDEEVSLKERTFDDGYTGLKRDSRGIATFSVKAGAKSIEVAYGPKYQVAVIYAPPGQNFVCFEPMTAITNGVNLAHDGKYRDLQSVLPASTWTESFWVRFRGF